MKAKQILQRGMIYPPGSDTIHKMWDRERKIERDDFGRRRKINWVYLSSWVKIL